jgi:DNA-binding CsgD family transcriptional regulator
LRTTLTRRETEVLELLMYGLTNIEIGERLFISPKTAEHHVGRILSRLGLHSRAEAAAHAARRLA